MRNFVRRVLRNCIPTLKNSRRKHDVDPICSICKSGLESMDRVLFHCLYSQHCWAISNLNLPHLEDILTEQKILICFGSLSTKDIELFRAVAWGLCAHTNKVVLEESLPKSDLVMRCCEQC